MSRNIVIPTGKRLTLPVPGALWTPAAITTAAWFDATDAGTITESGGAVSQWNDKSGNGNNLAQSTPAQQPETGLNTIGGLNVINFNRDNDDIMEAPNAASLNFDGDGGLSMFAVLNHEAYEDQGSGVNVICTKGDPLSATSAYFMRVNAGDNIRLHGGDNREAAAGAATNGQDLIASFVNEVATVHEGWIDGTSLGTAGDANGLSDNTEPFSVGGDYNQSQRYMDLNLGELIVIAGPGSTAARQQLEGYLAWKWSLQLNLPWNHPYRYYAPRA